MRNFTHPEGCICHMCLPGSESQQKVCTSQAPGSPECFNNHVTVADFFIRSQEKGVKVPNLPWRFCPWCGLQLPHNLKRENPS